MFKKIFSSFMLLCCALSSYAGALFTVDGLAYDWALYATGNNCVRVYYDESYQNLTSVVVPSTVVYDGTTYLVTEIGDNCFFQCYNLTSVTLGNNVTYLSNHAFSGCTNLTSVQMPAVKRITFCAFHYCTSLTSITLPSTLTHIDLYGAFRSCTSLKTIVCNAEQVPLTSNSSEYDSFAPATALLYVPSGCESKYQAASSWKNFMAISYIGDESLLDMKMNETELALSKESTATLTVTRYPDTATAETLSWSSSNPEVATVDQQGLVTAVNAGKATITVTSSNGLTATCDVTVAAEIYTLTYQVDGSEYKSQKYAEGSDITPIAAPKKVGYEFSGWQNMPSVMPDHDVTVTGTFSIGTYDLIYMLDGEEYKRYPLTYGTEITPESDPEARENYVFSGWSTIPSTMPGYDFTVTGSFVSTYYDVTLDAMDNMSALHLTIGESRLRYVVSLKISGTINSYDIMIFNNKMPNLKSLDLGDATIVANSYEYYTGYSSKADELDRYSIPNQLTSLVLPKNLKVIGAYGLAGKSKIQSLEIPSTVTTVGSYGFQNCSSLTSLDLPGVTSLGDNSLSGCGALTSLSLRSLCGKTMKNLFGNTSYANSEKLQDYTSTSNYTSYYYFPKSLKSVSITTGDIVTYAFYNCNVITSARLGSGVKKINSSSFYFCTNLKEIDIPDGITYIGSQAFYNCTSLQQINIPSGITEICYMAFSNCSALSHVDIPENVTKIGGSAFFGCKLLSDVIIPDKVTSIGETAFGYCFSLKSITIPQNVSSLEKGAIKSCSSLTSVTINNSVIGETMFEGCSKLATVTLSNNVKTINASAFKNCSSLKEINLPSSVQSIGSAAFSSCSSLTDVYVNSIEPATLTGDAFSTSQYQNAILHCPSASYYDYYYATSWSKFKNLASYDAELDNVSITQDFTLYTESAGTIGGNPRLDIAAGAGVTVVGATQQSFGDVYLNYDVANAKSASLIGNNNLAAENLYIQIDAKANTWQFLCFPYDIDLTKIEKEGSYVFRYYDSETRAADGTSGWKNVTGTTLEAGKGYIFHTNKAGILSLPVANPDLAARNEATALSEYGDENAEAENMNWNFVGNRYLAYIDINHLSYDAPIVVWNGTTYAAYRPGDDNYFLAPFQAFFVQKPTAINALSFDKGGRKTYTQMQAAQASAPARMAQGNADRQLVNLTLSDGEHTDQTRVVWNDQQSLGYELGCDAAKFTTTEAVPMLYSLDPKGVRYAINERPRDNGEVLLGFVASTSGYYTLEATRMDVPVYLYDNETEQTSSLTEGYTFYATAGTCNNRFVLTLNNPESISTIATEQSQPAAIYDLLGRKVSKANAGLYIEQGKKVTVNQ